MAAHGARAGGVGHLAAEAVEGAALALERVDDVHGGDGLAAGVKNTRSFCIIGAHVIMSHYLGEV